MIITLTCPRCKKISNDDLTKGYVAWNKMIIREGPEEKYICGQCYAETGEEIYMIEVLKEKPDAPPSP